jgi:hypothetical protein
MYPENVTEVSNSAVKTGQVASTVLAASAELAEQSHLLRQEVERTSLDERCDEADAETLPRQLRVAS